MVQTDNFAKKDSNLTTQGPMEFELKRRLDAGPLNHFQSIL